MKFFLSMIMVALLFSVSQVYCADCSTLWSNGFPDVRPLHTPVACDEFHPTSVPTTIDQRLYTVSSLTVNVAVKLQMEMIAEALSYAAAKYSSYGRVPPITIIREDAPHPNGGGAAAMGFAYVEFFDLTRETCPIFIYPISEVLNKEHLQQMVAHEVFHCVQKMNFKDQVSYAASASDQGWWFEGLAQFFSNIVYPANDFEYTTRFPAPDQSLPFFDQPNPYSSENFWQSYANTMSDNALWSLMNQMPTVAGEAAATTANNLPRISEALHNYAKEITLKRVRDAAGPMSPYDMPFEPHVLADSAHQEVNLSHYDFTVGAYRVTLPKSGKWHLRFDHPEETKISLKKLEEDAYAPVSGPLEVTSECDREREIQVVITTASDHQAMNTTRLIVDKEPNPDCDCVAHPDAPAQTDLCLIGSWDLDHASVAQFWNRLNTNPRAEFVSSTGGFAVTFLADHTGLWGASSWNLASLAHLDHAMTMHFSRITNGDSSFHYSANGNTVCSQQTSTSMTALQTIDINGRSGRSTSVLPFNPGLGTFTYSCNASEFVFRIYSFGGGSQDVEYVFHRR